MRTCVQLTVAAASALRFRHFDLQILGSGGAAEWTRAQLPSYFDPSQLWRRQLSGAPFLSCSSHVVKVSLDALYLNRFPQSFGFHISQYTGGASDNNRGATTSYSDITSESELYALDGVFFTPFLNHPAAVAHQKCIQCFDP